MKLTIDNPCLLRATAGEPLLIPTEHRVASPNGHIFQAGSHARLKGLVDFPEYNGELVTITNIREDGPHGRAYYIKGRCNLHINWVYEYRLEAMTAP